MGPVPQTTWPVTVPVPAWAEAGAASLGAARPPITKRDAATRPVSASLPVPIVLHLLLYITVRAAALFHQCGPALSPSAGSPPPAAGGCPGMGSAAEPASRRPRRSPGR